MVRPFWRFLAVLSCLALIGPLVRSQDKDAPKGPAKKAAPDAPATAPEDDYRQFFKKPQTVPEFWTAMQFEIEVGRFDLAGSHLRGLMALKPSAEDLYKLGDSVGMAPILQLRNIRPWVPVPKFDEKPYLDDIAKMEKARDDVEKIGKVRAELAKRRAAYEEAVAFNKQADKDVEDLIASTSDAIRKQLAAPERIKKFVKNLTAGPEEKDYALKELYRSGEAVVPYLIDEYRAAPIGERVHILDAMRRLGAGILPGLAAALDSDDAELKLDIIDIIQKRAAKELAPHLWYLAGSDAQPERVRQKAMETLSYLLETPATKLPPAKVALTREAERYHQHLVGFADPRAVTVWRWNGRNVAASLMPATKAEEYYGLRYAGQALALDPTYKPAQMILLAMALDKGYEQAGVAQSIAVTNPGVHELMATVNPDLVAAVLERALNERRFHVILGAVRALGEAGESRASRPTGQGEPALVRALNYPDRRIQMAAAEAVLRSPGKPSGQAANRVVDILRRVVAAEGVPPKGAGKVLVGFFNQVQGERVAAVVNKAGFDTIVVRTGREVLKRLNEATDIDLLILDADLPDPGLASLLGQLRADQNAGRLPLVLSASPNREDALRRYAERYNNISVVPEALTQDAKELAIALKAKVADPSRAPLSPDEARAYAENAIRYLGRMARGEFPGYDFSQAMEVIQKAAVSVQLSPEGQMASLEAASALAGARGQTLLLNAVLDNRRQPLVRIVAADFLTRHIQKHGVILSQNQVQGLESAFRQPDTDPGLKPRLAVLLGTLRPNARVTGERLRSFRPAATPVAPVPPAPMPPKEKEKEKEG